MTPEKKLMEDLYELQEKLNKLSRDAMRLHILIRISEMPVTSQLGTFHMFTIKGTRNVGHWSNAYIKER